MKAPRNPKTYIIGAGLVLALGLGLCFMQYQGIQEQLATLETLRKEAKDEKEVKAQLVTADKKVNELKAKLRHLEEGVPTFAYIPTLMNELESYGTKCGITVLGVRPALAPPNKNDKGEKKKSAYDEQNITVKGRGAYEDVLRFVKALNQFPKIVAVRMIALQPKVDPSNPGASPQLDVELEIRAYLFRDTQPVTSLEKVGEGA